MKTKILLYILLTPLLFADIFNFKTIEKANKAYSDGEFSKSAKLFESIQKKDPFVAYDMGNAYYKAGKYEEALHAYEKAEGVDEATRSYNMGNSFFQKQEFDKAIESYEKSLKLNDNADIRHNLKLAKNKKKEKEDKKKQEKKEKEKKEDNKKEDKKKEEEKKDKQKKSDEEKKKEDEDKKKAEKDKKSEKQKQQEAKNKKDKEMTPKEKMRKKELSHLLKQLSKKKMPTMMYQAGEDKREDSNVNPW